MYSHTSFGVFLCTLGTFTGFHRIDSYAEQATEEGGKAMEPVLGVEPGEARIGLLAGVQGVAIKGLGACIQSLFDTSDCGRNRWVGC